MCENFRSRQSSNDQGEEYKFEVSKMKEEPETTYPEEDPFTGLDVYSCIMTESELKIADKIDPPLILECPKESADKIGPQVAISKAFTMRVNSSETSLRSFDSRPDIKKPKNPSKQDKLMKLHTTINAGVKLLTCKICKYRTWKKFNMKVHKRTHFTPSFTTGCRQSHASNNPALNKRTRTRTEEKEAREKSFECDSRYSQNAPYINSIKHPITHTEEKLFKCDMCDFQTCNRWNLIAHKGTHTNREKPFKCDVYNYPSSFKSNLVNHESTHSCKNVLRIRPGEKEFSSDLCDCRTAHQANLNLHRSTDLEKRISTALCQENATTSNSAQERRQRRAKNSLPFQCESCNYSTYQKNKLSLHIKVHAGAKLFKCDECEYETVYHHNLKIHQRRRHINPMSDLMNYGRGKRDCAKVVVEQSYEETDTHLEPTNDEGRDQCLEPAHIEAKEHIKTACDKMFESNETAQVKMEEPIEPVYEKMDHLELAQVNRTSEPAQDRINWSNAVGLKKPVVLVVCDKCNYRTRYVSSMNIHKRIHSAEKPVKCDKCKFQCKNKSNMDVHKRLHKRNEVDPDWGKHERTRLNKKPFVCDICNYRCRWKANLVKHLRIHTGERPFKCNVCDYRSSQQSCLKVHMRTHTGEKPYMCEECGYRAGYQGSLRLHQEKTGHRESVHGAVISCRRKKHAKPLEQDHIVHQPLKPVCEEMDQLVKPDPDEMVQIIKPDPDEMDQLIKPDPDEVDQLIKPDPDDMSQLTEPVCADLDQLTEPVRDELDQLIKPDPDEFAELFKPVHDKFENLITPIHGDMDHDIEEMDSPANPTCPVCMKSEAKVFTFCCEQCHWFWARISKEGSGPPDCPGHRSEGEDLDCSGCRWGRYVIASQAWENQL